SPDVRLELGRRIVDICAEVLGVRKRTVLVEFTVHTGDEMLRDGDWAGEWTVAEASAEKPDTFVQTARTSCNEPLSDGARGCGDKRRGCRQDVKCRSRLKGQCRHIEARCGVCRSESQTTVTLSAAVQSSSPAEPPASASPPPAWSSIVVAASYSWAVLWTG